MNRYVLSCVAASVVALAAPANAVVVASLGGPTSGYLTLTSAGLFSGATQVASLSGGAVSATSTSTATRPAGTATGASFLAAGPTAGNATLTFSTPVSYLSFLWGSPDTYNVLTVTSSAGVQTYTTALLGITPSNGSTGFSQQVQFNTTGGTTISSIAFSNNPSTNAFETSNFSAAVPEPASWAMMVGGFGLLGSAMRRRQKATVSFA